MKPSTFAASPLLVLLVALPVTAATPDAVEEVRLALRTPVRDTTNKDELKFHKTTLADKCKAVKSIEAMRQTLMLQEWRDDDRDENIASVDREVRDDVAARFVKALQAAMKGTTVRKEAAATMVGEIGTTMRATGTRSGLMRELAPDLIALCEDDELAVREAAARSLGLIHPDPKVVGPVLGQLVRHKDMATRRAGAECLVNLMHTMNELTKGRRANGVDVSRDDVFQTCTVVVPAAARGLNDGDVATRRRCLEAVQLVALLLSDHTLDQPAESMFPPPGRKPSEEEKREMDAFRKMVEEERAAALPLARALNQQAAALAQALSADDLGVCETAARGLESMAEARMRLRRRAAAVPAALKEGPKDPLEEDPLRQGLLASVPALAKLLAHKDVRGRLAAVYALETLEADAAAAGDAAVRALTDDNSFVRWGAARILARLLTPPDNAVSGLAKALDDENGDVRVTAAAALERYGPAAKGAAAALGRAASHKDASMRVPAIKALAAIGPAGKEAAPALATALGDPEAEVRQAAARALGKLGPPDAATMAALRKALRDSDADVRRAASGALLGSE